MEREGFCQASSNDKTRQEDEVLLDSKLFSINETTSGPAILEYFDDNLLGVVQSKLSIRSEVDRLNKKDVALSMYIKTNASKQYIPPEETLESEKASLFSSSEIVQLTKIF